MDDLLEYKKKEMVEERQWLKQNSDLKLGQSWPELGKVKERGKVKQSSPSWVQGGEDYV